MNQLAVLAAYLIAVGSVTGGLLRDRSVAYSLLVDWAQAGDSAGRCNTRVNRKTYCFRFIIDLRADTYSAGEIYSYTAVAGVLRT